MREPKHTPGPWRLDKRASCAVVGEGGRMVASTSVHTSNTDDGEHVNENEANARLIAAAPELLKAAECFVAKVESGRARSADSYAQFKAAIARAIP